MLFITVTTGFSNELPKEGKGPSHPVKESIYIMPEQTGSPLEFGVGITPDKYTHFMDYRLSSSYLNPFDNKNTMSQHADVSTVVRIALDEFKFFTGLNQWIHGVENTMNGYSRKFRLTGEFNFNPNNTYPVDYIQKVNLVTEIYTAEKDVPLRRNPNKSILRQFKISKVTWDMGFHFDTPEILFKLGIGDAIMIQSSAGKDIKIGAMIKLSM